MIEQATLNKPGSGIDLPLSFPLFLEFKASSFKPRDVCATPTVGAVTTTFSLRIGLGFLILIPESGS